jgi:hypothetical protein
MDRRTFLKKSLQYGVGFYLFGAGLDNVAWAAKKEAAKFSAVIEDVKSQSSPRKLLPTVDYFSVIVVLSGECQYEEDNDGKKYKITLFNCDAAKAKRSISVNDRFVKKYEVKKNGANADVIVYFKEKGASCRAYLLHPDRFNKNYRLVIDTGLLDDKSSSVIGPIDAVEYNLMFHAMDTRQATDRIVLHHVGGTNEDVSAATIHRWHLNNGWSGIGYHFVIRKDGTVERGRPLDKVGAHTYGFNRDSVGICVVGEFNSYLPTNAQMDSAKKLITTLCRQYNIAPDRSHIFGHRDLGATECPGNHLYSQINAVCSYAQAHFLG